VFGTGVNTLSPIRASNYSKCGRREQTLSYHKSETIKQPEMQWRVVLLAFVITVIIGLIAAGVQCVSTKLPFPNRYTIQQ